MTLKQCSQLQEYPVVERKSSLEIEGLFAIKQNIVKCGANRGTNAKKAKGFQSLETLNQ